MKKSHEVPGILKFIVFLAILGVLAYLIFMGITNMTLESKIQKANEKAKEVKIAAQAWLDFVEGSENTKIKNPTGGVDIIFKSQSVGSSLSVADEQNNNTTMDLERDLPTGFNGYWVVVLNSLTKEIKYVLWSEEKLEDNQIQEFIGDELFDFCKKEKILMGYTN